MQFDAESDVRPLLAIVPARSGSKGIPGKNFRRLGNRPLIAYTIQSLSTLPIPNRLIVSTDDENIARWAQVHGLEVLARPDHLASDNTTISEVAVHVVVETGWDGDVGIFQPTSPLRSTETIERAVKLLRESGCDSVATCVREEHLCWRDKFDDIAQSTPLFSSRVNRQYAHHEVLRETGSVQLVTSQSLLRSGQVVGAAHRLIEAPRAESVDIDTLDDLVLARRLVQRGRVIFRVKANELVGSGHLYHCLQLADELIDQSLHFMLVDSDAWVGERLTDLNLSWSTERDMQVDLTALLSGCATVVVNDVLDTSETDILAQRAMGVTVVNIEDLGSGSKFAHWVVNALYDAGPHDDRVVSGARYATLRSEFLDLPKKQVRETAETVLVTFGGTDPGGLGLRCARLLAESTDCSIRVIEGPGSPPANYPVGVEVVRNIQSMATEMMAADLILTSAGRTVYEAAATGTPVAVLAQGARDATHAHLSLNDGVVFLGIGALTDDRHIVETVTRMLSSMRLRQELSDRLTGSLDGLGARRIADKIRSMLAGA